MFSFPISMCSNVCNENMFENTLQRKENPYNDLKGENEKHGIILADLFPFFVCGGLALCNFFFQFYN